MYLCTKDWSTKQPEKLVSVGLNPAKMSPNMKVVGK
jgi:hypothetical protein